MVEERVNTINAKEHAFIERKLAPVKDFNEVYVEVSKNSGLIGYSLVTLEDGKKHHHTTLLRMSLEPTGKQNYIVVIHYLEKVTIIDLLGSHHLATKIAKRYEDNLIHHSFVYKVGKLNVDSNKMVTFSGTDSLNPLAAFIIKACGFVSDGDAVLGEDLIKQIIKRG